MKAQPDYSIYLVTDDGCLQGRALIDCVREALEGGVTLVQYRAKTASSAEMYAEALQLKALCDSFNVPLIINDRLDIAMAVGAAGVHLGQDDLLRCGTQASRRGLHHWRFGAQSGGG